MNGELLLKLAFLLYGVSTVGFFFYFYSMRQEALRGARFVLSLGFFTQLVFILVKVKSLGTLPVISFREVSSFLAWAVVGAYFVISYKGPKVYTLGTFLLPVVMVLVAAALVSPPRVEPPPPILRTFWFPVHAITAILSYAFFIVAAVAGFMYLVQEHYVKKKKLKGLFKKLPPLESLDKVNELCLKYGFPLLTVGIITGALWAEKAWGTYWSWSPKETWSLVLWFIYAALLHERLAVGWRGRRAAFTALLGFVVWMVSFFVINLTATGYHAYGTW